MTMQEKPTWTTRHSLIQRLCDPSDHDAWERFDQHYRPFLFSLLNKMQVNSADQDDLCQEILIRLHKSVGTYVRDRARFRTWLSTIIRNTACSYFSKTQRRTEKYDQLKHTPEFLTGTGTSDFEQIVESEWKNYLTEEAFRRLRAAFSDTIVDCFRMTLEQVPVDEIAAKIGIKKETVYTIRTRMRSRVLHQMQNLIRELEF